MQFTVKASGNGLTYQWQYRQPGSKIWKSTILPGSRSDTLTVLASSLRNGYQFRCVLNDALGNRVTTDAATLAFAKTPAITQQPESLALCAGETAQFTVTATGGGLSYQWQYAKAGSSDWMDSTMPGADTDTLSVEATAARNGEQYRCVITNAAGSVVSDPATLQVLAITLQPKDFTGPAGSSVSFKVDAVGENLSYQWQYSDNNGAKWTNGASRTDVYNTKLTASRNGRLVRCIVTDEYGDSVISDAASMRISSLAITEQPEDYIGAANSTAEFTVAATGDGLSYQWQFSDNGGGKWSRSSVTAPVYSARLTAAKNGRLVRCIVTDQYGTSVTSKSAKMILSNLAITGQPQDYTGALNSTAAFMVIAEGEGLTYQWQISDTGGAKWSKSTATSAVYSAKLTAAKDGRLVRCIVTDQNGYCIYFFLKYFIRN